MALKNTLDIDYYAKAITSLSINNASYFLFSDDPLWVSKEFAPKLLSNNYHIVSSNQGSESHNDMRLMSLCKHNIIANSSFSWWAAWLNLNPEKVVVAPHKWFSDNKNTRDLIPKEWVML